jgi:hypothetical protein
MEFGLQHYPPRNTRLMQCGKNALPHLFMGQLAFRVDGNVENKHNPVCVID